MDTIDFTVYLKQLVTSKMHNGLCDNCTRPLGQLVGWEGKQRLLSIRMHCPQCGSGHTVARKRSGTVVQVTPDLQIVSHGIYCRKCEHASHQYEAFINCQAAPPTTELKRIQKAQQVTQSVGMDVEEFKRKLLELREKRGADAPETDVKKKA